jgi:hypothetical protein
VTFLSVRDIGDPKVKEHRGRIVKTTGDGLLIEFASVVDAVRCAVEVQRGMVERNGAIPADERIEFRVGINLGDVIVEGEDIFGDGVNIAARLEALAEVRDKVDFGFEDLGEQRVKNIARPVRVYRVRDRAAPLGQFVPATFQPLPLPDKPSIAVLPFVNMSGDPEQEFFADGIAEDIITQLAGWRVDRLVPGLPTPGRARPGRGGGAPWPGDHGAGLGRETGVRRVRQPTGQHGSERPATTITKWPARRSSHPSLAPPRKRRFAHQVPTGRESPHRTPARKSGNAGEGWR